MNALSLARWQFAITTVYHFIFVPITIGSGFLVAGFQTAWYRTNKDQYLRATKFFGKLFLINFAIGVVTGIVQEFQFGMNWSAYSRLVGNIFGAPLAIEALLAFFLESTFLGLWIFGDGKGEFIRFQLWDTKGRFANWLPAMNYKGWRLHVFPMLDAPRFDWSSVDYLVLYFNSIPAQASVRVRFDDLRAIPALLPVRPLCIPSFAVGTAKLTYNVTVTLVISTGMGVSYLPDRGLSCCAVRVKA